MRKLDGRFRTLGKTRGGEIPKRENKFCGVEFYKATGENFKYVATVI